MLTEDKYFTRLNRSYYTVISHGTEDGKIQLDPYNFLELEDIPIMNNNILSIFGVCFGGKTGNAADTVVNKKRSYGAIGWETKIGLFSTDLFIKTFWSFYLSNNLYTNERAIIDTLIYFKKNFPLTIHNENPITKPILYQKDEMRKKYSLNGDIETNSCNSFSYSDGYRVFKKTNFTSTSFSYLGNTSMNMRKVIQVLNGATLHKLEDVIIPIDNEYHLVTISLDKNYNQVFFDNYTNQFLSYDEIAIIESELLK